MRKDKRKNLFLVILCILGIITVAGCFSNFSDQRSSESEKTQTKTVESKTKLMVGTYEKSISTDGNSTMFDGCMYQGCIYEDTAEQSALEDWEYSQAKIDYGFDLAIMCKEILTELNRDYSFGLEISIFLSEMINSESLILQCNGVSKITLIGTNVETNETSKLEKTIYNENSVVNAKGFNSNIGIICLSIDNPRDVIKYGGYVKSVIESTNGMLVNVYENGELVHTIDVLTTDSEFKEVDGYDGLKFIDLTNVMQKYIGNKGIAEWCNEQNYVEVVTKYTYANYVSAGIKITDAGLYLINVPTSDGAQVETARYKIYEKYIGR